ncbi:isoprenylcysteine carboxyl methyltransferase family protein [Metabacillus arenae]|nr:isoprenylcysteine carboxylmethyltransferase family protein [Metabacillus arenae]
MMYVVFAFLLAQRVSELFIANRNEKWMKAQGAREYAKEHYPFIVGLHVLFLLSFFIEVTVFHKTLSPLWFLLLPLIIFTQLIRYWAIYSLGPYWNTKIIVMPGTNVILKGPYKFLKHPNYTVVALEIILFPLLFNAYLTAVMFTVLNVILMKIRIPAEEKVLETVTDYRSIFATKSRFIPKRK